MPEQIPEALRTALGGRYDLMSVLGRGGMATVYLAADRKHHRQVALKVLRQDLAASIGAERFLKEIEIAARLTHPHILALHDSGDADGILYYVMPFIDGGSLRTRLEAQGRLDVPAALAITSQVAGALGYAHRMGVLHRDIKPENILFAQGLPVVADFGIAKAISTAGGENLTRTGFPLGTPGYMSPEQAAGLTDLDVRTDVYSLAVVCYEMLTGRTPGRWPTEDAVRAGKFLDASPSLRLTLDALPAPIEPALVRAMAIRHDQRTDTPATLVAELGGAPPPERTSGESEEKPLSGLILRAGYRPAAPPARKYSDEEVQAVLKRAAELDASSGTMSGALTIGGIQAAAAEAGIDPEFVKRAAQQMVRPRTEPVTDPFARAKPFTGAWFAGAPTKLVVERVVQGELAEADCAYLIEEIRTEFGNTGIVSTLGKTVSWVTARTPSGMGRDIQLAVTMRSGQTRIVIREGLGSSLGATFGGIGGGVGGGMAGPIMGIIAGALHAPGAGMVVWGLWVVGVMAGARSIYRYNTLNKHKDMGALADRLAAMAQSLISEALPHHTPPERLPA